MDEIAARVKILEMEDLSIAEMLDRLARVEAEKVRLQDFARWIIALDDPDGPGFDARKSVTMGQIIGKAREALALPEEF